MNSRQRFIQTFRYSNPDRVPLFEEGIRDSVKEIWHEQNMLSSKQLSELFNYDLREEIHLELEHNQDLAQLAKLNNGLEILQQSLNPNDKRRLPKNWKQRVRKLQICEHPVMLVVHHGFFQTLGVEEWSNFSELLYLLADQPDFVKRVLDIQSVFSASLTEIVLKEINIDAAIFSEPIASTHGPLISPSMYKEFVLTSYKPIFDILKKHGINIIILRTYSNIKTLLPEAVEAGFNCLWANERGTIELDYLTLRREFGSRLRLIGGLDLNTLRQGNDSISRELIRVVPPLLKDGGYYPLLDGRVRQDIPFDTYSFYRQSLEKLALI